MSEEKEYTLLSRDEVKSTFKDLYGTELVDGKTLLNADQIEEKLSDPKCWYNNLQENYRYTMNEWEYETGFGGARILYRELIRTGSSIEEIDRHICVLIEGRPIPLANLKLIADDESQGENG